MWRLQNSTATKSKLIAKPAEEEHGPSFTEITLDVHAEDPAPSFSGTRH